MPEPEMNAKGPVASPRGRLHLSLAQPRQAVANRLFSRPGKRSRAPCHSPNQRQFAPCSHSISSTNFATAAGTRKLLWATAARFADQTGVTSTPPEKSARPRLGHDFFHDLLAESRSCAQNHDNHGIQAADDKLQAGPNVYRRNAQCLALSTEQLKQRQGSKSLSNRKHSGPA
jgi:hypothetical protein